MLVRGVNGAETKKIKKNERLTTVWQYDGFSAKLNGSSSIELLC